MHKKSVPQDQFIGLSDHQIKEKINEYNKQIETSLWLRPGLVSRGCIKINHGNKEVVGNM